MKITERSGSLSTNDGKRPTRNTARTFFAKWGRADVSLPELLSSDRSVVNRVSQSTCRRKNVCAPAEHQLLVASPLLHGIKRSAFTQRKRFGSTRCSAIGACSRAICHHSRGQATGSPSSSRYHQQLQSTSYCEHAYEARWWGDPEYDGALRRPQTRPRPASCRFPAV